MNSQQLKRCKLPDSPGVYFFKKGKKALYVGKATALRDRVRSYFSADLVEARGARIVEMVASASSVDFQKTDSVLEALLLEAELIRRLQPSYNVLGRDDKTFNCVVITEEDFPSVIIRRKKEIEEGGMSYRNIFGPFPNGSQLREAMKIIRRIFPYRDEKCRPPVLGKPSRPCFNYEIGLCPGVCTGVISKQDYQMIVRDIEMLFRGNKTGLIRNLEKEMRSYVKREMYENAAIVKKRIGALNHIQDVALIKKNDESGRWTSNFRIEAYDVAHFAGTNAKGVMTVVTNGEKSAGDYRVFNLRGAKPGNDTSALADIIGRRFGHAEWNYPRLVVVDGGKQQLNAAGRTLSSSGILLPVVAVTKDERHKPKAIIGDRSKIVGRERDILLANSEAHCFSVKSHRISARKSFREQIGAVPRNNSISSQT